MKFSRFFENGHFSKVKYFYCVSLLKHEFLCKYFYILSKFELHHLQNNSQWVFDGDYHYLLLSFLFLYKTCPPKNGLFTTEKDSDIM